jgi:hypothetical protein
MSGISRGFGMIVTAAYLLLETGGKDSRNFEQARGTRQNQPVLELPGGSLLASAEGRNLPSVQNQPKQHCLKAGLQFEPVRDPPSGVHSQPVSPQQCAVRSVNWYWCVSYGIECTPNRRPLGAPSACCSDARVRNPRDFWRKGVPCLKNRHGVYAYCSVPCRLARSWL